MKVITKLKKVFGRKFNSRDYWRRRYRSGGTSGSGSYGNLCTYKAAIINATVYEHKIESVVELGFGDGNQANTFEFENYTGIEIVPELVDRAKKIFSDRPTWNFFLEDNFDFADQRFDLSMSLDVLYHLIEDDVFDDYMKRLFNLSDRFILIYASDIEKITSNAHVRHRSYSKWIDEHVPNVVLEKSWDNQYPYDKDSDPSKTSFANFKLYRKL